MRVSVIKPNLKIRTNDYLNVLVIFLCQSRRMKLLSLKQKKTLLQIKRIDSTDQSVCLLSVVQEISIENRFL